MTHILDSLGVWFADYYLLSAVLLLLALVTVRIVRQPVHRLAIVKSTIVALALLAGLCALPGWSIVHLITAQRQESPPVLQLTPPPTDPFLLKEWIVRTDGDVNAEQPRPMTPAATAEKPAGSHWNLSWLSTLAAVQLAGLIGVVAWLSCGGLAAQRLRRSASPAPTELVAVLTEVATARSRISPKLDPASRRDAATWSSLSETRNQTEIELLISERIDVPVALGIRHPAILLPYSFANSQSAIPGTPWVPQSEIRLILAHEVAHIRNRDLHWLAASRALMILLCSQPLYWFLRRRMRLDQEVLADAVAAEETSRQQYAEQLIDWARNISRRRTVRIASAVGLWEGPSQLRRRIALLLNEQFTVLCNCPRPWRVAATLLGILAALALSTVTLQPTIRADENDEPTVEQGPAEPATPPADAAAARAIPRPEPNAIVGRAVDEERMPVAGARVVLFRRNHNDLSRSLLGEKTTDADGRFRFDNVIDVAREFPDGKIPPQDVWPDQLLQLVVKASGRVTYTAIHLPQTVAQQGRIEQPILRPAATLRGRVTGPDGKPVAGVLLSFGFGLLDHWEGAQSARTDADGNYTIDDLPPFDVDKYRNEQDEQRTRLAQKTGVKYSDSMLFAPPPIIAIKHPDFASKRIGPKQIPGTQDVQLEAAAILEGSVVFGDTSKPAAGARVVIGTTISQESQPAAAPIHFYQLHNESVRADENGKFRFANLPAGKYSLWATLPNWVHEGIEGIAATTDKTTKAPDLTLTKGGLISIRLVDSKTRKAVSLQPDAVAWVGMTTQPASGRGRLIDPRSITISAEGVFDVQALPGESRIWVSQVSTDGEQKWTGADLPTVTLADGQKAKVDVGVVDVEAAKTKAPNGVVLFGGGAPLPSSEK